MDVSIETSMANVIYEWFPSLDEIEEQFGKIVRDVVDEVTDQKDLPSKERKRLQVINAPKKSPRAKLVKLADKLYNLRDLHKSPPA